MVSRPQFLTLFSIQLTLRFRDPQVCQIEDDQFCFCRGELRKYFCGKAG